MGFNVKFYLWTIFNLNNCATIFSPKKKQQEEKLEPDPKTKGK